MNQLILWAPLVFGAYMVVTGWLGLVGRLPKNDWVGMRLHVVMRDEETWRIGNRAAAAWLIGGGLLELVGGMVLVVAHGRVVPGAPLPLLLVGFAVAVFGVAAWRAQDAVRRRG